jgi:hypothetical protein
MSMSMSDSLNESDIDIDIVVVKYCNFSSHPALDASQSELSPPLPSLSFLYLLYVYPTETMHLQTYFPTTFADWDRRREIHAMRCYACMKFKVHYDTISGFADVISV